MGDNVIRLPGEEKPPMPRVIVSKEETEDNEGRKVVVITQITPQVFPPVIHYVGTCQPTPLKGGVFSFKIEALNLEDAYFKWDTMCQTSWNEFVKSQRAKLIVPG